MSLSTSMTHAVPCRWTGAGRVWTVANWAQQSVHASPFSAHPTETFCNQQTEFWKYVKVPRIFKRWFKNPGQRIRIRMYPQSIQLLIQIRSHVFMYLRSTSHENSFSFANVPKHRTYFREDCVSLCCIPGDVVGECGIPVREAQSPSNSIVEEEGALHK